VNRYWPRYVWMIKCLITVYEKQLVIIMKILLKLGIAPKAITLIKYMYIISLIEQKLLDSKVEEKNPIMFNIHNICKDIQVLT